MNILEKNIQDTSELVIKIKELEDKYEKQELKNKFENQIIIFDKRKI